MQESDEEAVTEAETAETEAPEATEAEEAEPTEAEETEITAETQATEPEIQETEIQETEAQLDAEETKEELPVFDIAAEEGAVMALAWGDQLLVVYGGEAEQKLALQLAAYCAPENAPVMLYEKTEGEWLDIAAVMTQLLGENWGESLIEVAADAEEMSASMELQHFLQVPVMRISCESAEVYLFAYPQEADDVALMQQSAEAAGWTVVETERSMVVAVSKVEG